MEQTMMQQKLVADESNRLWDMRYWLLASSMEEGGKIFGVAIDRCVEEQVVEREEVFGISRRKDEVLLFLDRLSGGDAMPVELTALADDYIFEMEEFF